MSRELWIHGRYRALRDELLEIVKHLFISLLEERDGCSKLPCSTCSTDSMGVSRDITGHLPIDDQRDIGDIETTTGNLRIVSEALGDAPEGKGSHLSPPTLLHFHLSTSAQPLLVRPESYRTRA